MATSRPVPDVAQSDLATLMTSIFPEKQKGCTIETIDFTQDCKKSFALLQSDSNITLVKDWLEGFRNSKPILRLLVIVLNVSAPKTPVTKSNKFLETLELAVIDRSSLQSSATDVLSISVTISRPLFASVSNFIPRQTVLLFAHPAPHASRNRFRLTHLSEIYINPPIPETSALRKWTARVFPQLPLNVTAKPGQNHSPVSQLADVLNRQHQHHFSRSQYTLSLFLDKIDLHHQYKFHRSPLWRRNSATFTGYTSVLVTHIPLVNLCQKQKLFGGTCSTCLVDLSANTPTTTHVCITPPFKDPTTISSINSYDSATVPASVTVALSWNSGILGGLSDETAGLLVQSDPQSCRHNLNLTDEAILGLTGLKRSDFEDAGFWSEEERQKMLDRLSWIEKQVLWERVTLLLGWCVECCCHSKEGVGVNSCNCNCDYRRTVSGDRDGQDRIVVLRISS